MEAILKRNFPFWESLTQDEKDKLINSAYISEQKKGTVVHHGGNECTGVEIIMSGQARVFMNSPGGGEITLYRLLEDDVCILSAACMIKNLDLDVNMEFEEDTKFLLIPKGAYEEISNSNPAVKDYNLGVVSEKFSDVMWLFNQYVFSNMAKRLATNLLEHRALLSSDTLQITHITIAKDLGTAREVITRLLKQFQTDGIISLSRGQIEIIDAKKLSQI
ncbi:MAG: Crp/Fnr family transcriptional regulator [Anaerovoracaceae bacterium]